MELNSDQKADFKLLKSQIMNDIRTEPALTEEQISDTVRKLQDCNDYDLYQRMRRRRIDARGLHVYLQGLKRRSQDRVSEADKAKAKYNSEPDELEYIKNRLGLHSGSSVEMVRKELKRLKPKSEATWKALKLNKAKILKDYKI